MKIQNKFKAELTERMKKDSGYMITAYPRLYNKVITELAKPFRKEKFDKIMSPEMKGMLFGPTVAYNLKKPFVCIIKQGRVPESFVVGKRFKDYSKKYKTLQIAKPTIKKNEKILIIDDFFESGESGKAIISLIEKLNGKVVGISIIYNKLKKEDEEFFKKYNFHYLLKVK